MAKKKPNKEPDYGSQFPLCDSAPEDLSMGGVSSILTGAAAAKREKIWKERHRLSVYFMNPDDIDDWGWRCRGEPMNISTIFAWARVWNFVEYPEIPSIELSGIARRADIRVKFSNTGGNWSMVGMEATAVKDLNKPTLQLNLGGHSPDLQECTVVHQFGHALGLEHEHQISDFWDVLGKHLDGEKMREDPQVSIAFMKQWATASFEEPLVNSLSEYDPESIMHYKFDIKWIKNEVLQTYENIDKADSLDMKEKKYFKALQDRSKKDQLSKRPTISDYRVLVQAYGCVFNENSKNLQKLREHLVALDRGRVDTEKVLRVNTHLRVTRNTVWPARAEWRNLGAELLITLGTLDAINLDRRNAGDKLGAVLEKWMYTGKATIYDLISALRSVSVLRGDLADEILSHKDKPDAAQYGFYEEGEKIKEKESKLPGEVLNASNIDLRDSGVTTENLIDGNRSTSKYPLCDRAPEVVPVGSVSSILTGAAAVKKEKIWSERQQLKVYFMNPDDINDWGWRCRGEPMNISTIFAWARVWKFVEYPEIPSIELSERAQRADIRVQFSNTGGNWSMVGMEATDVEDLNKPTMQLNLGGHSPDLQECTVVHQFGHALGLEHEHQSSDFWDVLGKHLDVEKMREDPQVSIAFMKQWATASSKEPSVNSLSEYDPESIMHYKFDIKWIRNVVLRNYENIDKDLSLGMKEKKYLKALHKRSKKGQLSKRPTISDYRVLVQAYGHVFNENSEYLQRLQEHLVAPDRERVDTETVLRVNTHLRAIRNTVWPARAEWRNLGAELLITPGTLDAIDVDRRNVGDKLGAVLEKWMYTGKATIGDLISALRSVSVLRGDLADEILAHKDKPDAAQYGFYQESVLKFVIHPRTTISEPGLKVELTVKTNPSAKTYTWYFEEEAIVEADFYEGVTTDQLIIPKLVPRHKGVYKCVVTNESNERFTSKEATVEIKGEKIKEKESKLLGEILNASNIDLRDSGVTTENLINGNRSLFTYEEMEIVMKENPTTRLLSINLKQALQSRLKEEEAYQLAITHGKKVSLVYLKILALGPGQIGKSTFLYRLLGLMDGNIETASSGSLPSCSTGQADLRDVCIKFINMTGAVKEDNEWERCELESQVEGLLRLLPEQIQEELSEPPKNPTQDSSISSEESVDDSVQAEESPQAKNNSTPSDVSSPIAEQQGRESSKDTPLATVVKQQPKSTSVTIPSPSSELVDATLKKYDDIRDKCKHSPNVTKLHMLFNIADVGGQPAFLDMLPSLTIGPALYLLFSKLVNDSGQVLSTSDLTKQQAVKYRAQTDEEPQDCEGYTYALQEVLFSTLSSIACFGLSDKEVEKYIAKESGPQKTSSLAVLMGTFADKIDTDDKKTALSTTESELKSYLEKTHFCEKNLVDFPNPKFCNHSDGQVFYRVNNKTGNKEEVSDYREKIQDLIKEKFRKYDIPASWLGLGICMKILANNKTTYKVSFDDCVEMGFKHFNLTKEEVEAALNFLHKYIGLIMYFPNDEHLKQLVICDPQVVFSSVSELTFNVYDSTSRKQQRSEESTQQKKFERTGIFSPDEVEYKSSEKILTFLELVHLLVHLNIAAEITTSDSDENKSMEPSAVSGGATDLAQSKRYFLPAVLRTEEVSALIVTRQPNEELLPEPLCIRFQSGFLPMGFACALAARLMAEEKFTLLTNDQILYKNKLKFRFNKRFNITMISLPLRCEFRVTRHNGSEEFHEPECCPEMLEVICRAADFVIKSMQKALVSENNYDLAFKCPLEENNQNVQFGYEPLAKFVYSDKSKQLKQIECLECESAIKLDDSDFKPNMKVWLGQTSAIPLKVNKHLTMTSNNSIKIIAEGTTPLKYQWFLDEEELTIDDDDYEGSTTASLVIKNSDFLSEGCYKCEVTDKFGESSTSNHIDLFAEELKRYKIKKAIIQKLKKNGVCSIEVLCKLDINKLNLKEGERVIVEQFLQLMAFPVAKSSANGLTLDEVKKAAFQARSKWFDMGIELDIGLDTLKVIRSKNYYDTDRCFSDMLSHWLSRTEPPLPTMAALRSALMSPIIGRQDLRGDIKTDSEPDKTEGKFTLKEVRRVTWDVRSKWKRLGGELEVDPGTLDAIESTNRYVVEDCFTDLLSHWFDQKSPLTSAFKLVKALRSQVVGRVDIADSVSAKWGEETKAV